MSRFQTHAAGLIVAALGLLCAAPAAAQTVFFDDFDGNALKPHWQAPPPEHWDHEVSGGFLTVKKLFYPSNPHQLSNIAFIDAEFPLLSGDFLVRYRAGWERDSLTAGISLRDHTGQSILSLIYSEGQVTPQTRVANGQSVPAPVEGVFDFLVRRTGQEASFFFNNQLLETLPVHDHPARNVHLIFLAPYPDPGVRPFRVDLIHIVPAPSGSALAVLFLMVLSRRRR